jgi:hypothetical protein
VAYSLYCLISLRRYVRYQPEEEEEEDRSQMDEDAANTAEGEEESAEGVQSLQQEDKDKDDSNSNNYDEEPRIRAVEHLIVRQVLKCSMLHDCSNRKTLTRTAPLFACMT